MNGGSERESSVEDAELLYERVFDKFGEIIEGMSAEEVWFMKLGMLKEFIDENFPNRHRLILGNSLITIPKFPTQKFDLIFIDGGHAYNVSKSDIENCKRLSHKETIIVMDDTMNKPEWEKSWNKGVNKAWRESIDEGLIVQNGFEDYGKGRGLSWGRYK